MSKSISMTKFIFFLPLIVGVSASYYVIDRGGILCDFANAPLTIENSEVCIKSGFENIFNPAVIGNEDLYLVRYKERKMNKCLWVNTKDNQILLDGRQFGFSELCSATKRKLQIRGVYREDNHLTAPQ